MNTSLKGSQRTKDGTGSNQIRACIRNTYNSSKQRIGDPIASQSERSRQMVEKDFSPPDKVFVCRPCPDFVSSGSTCYLAVSNQDLYGVDGCRITNMKIEHPILMVSLENAAETSFAQQVSELSLRTSRDESSKFHPSLLTVRQSTLEQLSGDG